MKLSLEIGQDTPEKNCFLFEGLILYGAGWDKSSGCLVLTEKSKTPLPVSRFRWTKGEGGHKGPQKGEAPEKIQVSIPVYLNESFKDLLFSANIPAFSALPVNLWTQRAVSITVWAP